MAEEDIDRIYTYIKKYCSLGVHPHQLAKALNLDQKKVISALKDLEKQGKIQLRTSNIEWKFNQRLMKES